MMSAPHMQNTIGCLLLKQCHKATMATNRGVLTVVAHRDQFVAPHQDKTSSIFTISAKMLTAV